MKRRRNGVTFLSNKEENDINDNEIVSSVFNNEILMKIYVNEENMENIEE